MEHQVIIQSPSAMTHTEIHQPVRAICSRCLQSSGLDRCVTIRAPRLPHLHQPQLPKVPHGGSGPIPEGPKADLSTMRMKRNARRKSPVC
jgi:hypothetical protein